MIEIPRMKQERQDEVRGEWWQVFRVFSRVKVVAESAVEKKSVCPLFIPHDHAASPDIHNGHHVDFSEKDEKMESHLIDHVDHIHNDRTHGWRQKSGV